jgi:hypothetical protein
MIQIKMAAQSAEKPWRLVAEWQSNPVECEIEMAGTTD